mmetsp:Transcript_790/g.2122  ORF Transcript_790/g.2122 Transcript_790/m.2122 type:complete len:157 (+) Transcript_790:62-532(+)
MQHMNRISPLYIPLQASANGHGLRASQSTASFWQEYWRPSASSNYHGAGPRPGLPATPPSRRSSASSGRSQGSQMERRQSKKAPSPLVSVASSTATKTINTTCHGLGFEDVHLKSLRQRASSAPGHLDRLLGRCRAGGELYAGNTYKGSRDTLLGM